MSLFAHDEAGAPRDALTGLPDVGNLRLHLENWLAQAASTGETARRRLRHR